MHHSGFGYYSCYISKHIIREVGGSFDMASKKFSPLSLTLPCWPILQQSFVKNLFLKFSGILRKNYGKCLPPKELSCGFKFENQPLQNIGGKVFNHDLSQILQKWEFCAFGMTFLRKNIRLKLLFKHRVKHKHPCALEIRIKDPSHKINPTNLKGYVVSWLTKFKLDKDFSYPTLDNFWIDFFL